MHLNIGEKICATDIRLPRTFDVRGLWASSQTLCNCFLMAGKWRWQPIQVHESRKNIDGGDVISGKKIDYILADRLIAGHAANCDFRASASDPKASRSKNGSLNFDAKWTQIIAQNTVYEQFLLLSFHVYKQF